MKDLQQGTNGKELSGSAKLLNELQQIFEIYADDLQKFRLGKLNAEDPKSTYRLLYDTEMFDIVVKLLNVSDKIKKLDAVDEQPEEKTTIAKVKNIQDLALNSKKGA